MEKRCPLCLMSAVSDHVVVTRSGDDVYYCIMMISTDTPVCSNIDVSQRECNSDLFLAKAKG
eukprot:5666141-Pleurochrysis_carterae.AAC.3